MTHEALSLAIKSAGGPKAVARKLGITHQAVIQWKECPPHRVLEIERLSGISRSVLRPDLYPREGRA
jgi:DNA-binding transcriptional regulator YdaS (Cro superfamily)